MDQIEVTYRKGYDFGMGVKAASGSPVGLGVVGSPTPVQGASGGSGGFQMTKVQTTEELESHLGISADASGGVGLFSASDRFSFARDCKVQSSSITLLLLCTRAFGFVQIDDPALSQGAGQLVGNGKIDLFSDRYGDCFVRGISSGGQFFGVIRIDAQSSETRQNIENSLSGSYGPFSADVAVKLSEAMKSSRSSAEVRLYYEGGDVKTKPQTPEELFAAANEWSNSLAEQQRPYSVTLAPYIIANGPPPLNRADLEHQHDVLARCAKLRSATLDKQNLVDYILDPAHREEFEIVAGGPDLAALSSGLANDLDIIAQAASFAIDNPKEALDPESFGRNKNGLAAYALTILPPNMPNHRGATVTIPNFRSLNSQSAAEKLAADNHLTIHWVESASVGQPWHIDSQDPPPNTPVSLGATVTLVCTQSTNNLRFRLHDVLLNPALSKIARTGHS
jgi:hypothetical protein